jgi:hypothetical protein
MTPKEKAQELVNKYTNAGFNCKDCDMPFCDMKCTILHKHEAKECALIVVDEILQADMFMMTEAQEEFWEQVRQEILDL